MNNKKPRLMKCVANREGIVETGRISFCGGGTAFVTYRNTWNHDILSSDLDDCSDGDSCC